ncbi:unnamed protein product [Adineta ricciae]|uniref:Uncharacterized protein n=1 Tax=Adineta ricciae TaxID=249248 RepID=A0A815GD37_ADIRI|nr:unnamed protein product [Adineta ricciae]
MVNETSLSQVSSSTMNILAQFFRCHLVYKASLMGVSIEKAESIVMFSQLSRYSFRVGLICHVESAETY